MTHLEQTWDLDRIFPGGSKSPELQTHLRALEADIAAFSRRVAGAMPPQAVTGQAGAWSDLIGRLQDLVGRLREAAAFVSCLTAQNVKDEPAKLLGGRVKQLYAALNAALTQLDSQIISIPEPVWNQMLTGEALQPIAYPLQERRERAREKMGPELEALAGDLSVDGYHAWGELYNTVVGRITVPVAENGKTLNLSVGQAFNRLRSGDRAAREALFPKWESAWAKEADLIAMALNHLGGYRVNLYKHRGWDSILAEPLANNRMTSQTLEAMWGVVDRNKAKLLAYMERKAKLLGVEKLHWNDVEAPLGTASAQVTYGEAADFIIEQFRSFSPEMAEFAAQAFEQRWIESEDRPGKRPGGFCTSFPLARESRIFLTFSGAPSNVATLAHELGHAYHQHLVNDLPLLAQNYAMNVAETASTFAEMLVSDAALQRAQTKEERLALLGEKVERAIAFFMDIQARFLFELDFYAERKEGLVSVARLNELMVGAQKKAFCGALSGYHPHFWASKLHFYSTGQPFYNFPYTFGYLFSAGVYARARAEGQGFASRYAALLRDTGRMTVERLAHRHLGVDLRQPDFWQQAADLVLADVDQFIRLTD